MMAGCFYSVEGAPSPERLPVLHSASSKGGMDEVVFPGAILFPRTLAGTGKPLFNLHVFFFFGQDQCCSFLVFGFSSSRPGGFLVCQLLPVIHFILGGSWSVKESTLWQRKTGDKIKLFWEFVKPLMLRIFTLYSFFKFVLLIDLRERHTDLLFHLFMHPSVGSLTYPDQNQTHALGVSGRCPNQWRHLTGALLYIFPKELRALEDNLPNSPK